MWASGVSWLSGGKETGMELDVSSKRAKKLMREHGLTDEEIQQIVASARINLATFDPEYRTNVTQIADDLQKSRPTIYGWADRAIAATIHSLRNIRTGRPPKERDRSNGVES
jgi:transposase